MSAPDPRVFVAHLRARADQAEARHERREEGDTALDLWDLRKRAMRYRRYANNLEQFLDEGKLP